VLDCRYLGCDRLSDPPRGAGDVPGEPDLSALAAGDPTPDVLVPYWLGAPARAALAATVRHGLNAGEVHPVAAIHLADVLTELHVAMARDAVWPDLAARVRRVTGWNDDVLPVRLSAVELESVLALAALPEALRAALARVPR
jgi:hypothetical protein